jgi:hypothetical protein
MPSGTRMRPYKRRQKKYLGIFVYLVEQTKHNKMEVLTNPENCKLMSYWLSPYLIRA